MRSQPCPQRQPLPDPRDGLGLAILWPPPSPPTTPPRRQWPRQLRKPAGWVGQNFLSRSAALGRRRQTRRRPPLPNQHLLNCLRGCLAAAGSSRKAAEGAMAGPQQIFTQKTTENLQRLQRSQRSYHPCMNILKQCRRRKRRWQRMRRKGEPATWTLRCRRTSRLTSFSPWSTTSWRRATTSSWMTPTNGGGQQCQDQNQDRARGHPRGRGEAGHSRLHAIRPRGHALTHTTHRLPRGGHGHDHRVGDRDRGEHDRRRSPDAKDRRASWIADVSPARASDRFRTSVVLQVRRRRIQAEAAQAGQGRGHGDPGQGLCQGRHPGAGAEVENLKEQCFFCEESKNTPNTKFIYDYFNIF